MSASTVTVIGALKESLLGWAWPPVINVARSTVLGIFSRVEAGSLLIIDQASGAKYHFGQSRFDEDGINVKVNSIYTIPRAEIVVKRDSFWLRLLLFADVGFAEGYMLGDFECDDLTSFFRLFIINRDKLNNGMTAFSALLALASTLGQSTNTLANSLLNVAAHYDISNDMFAAFLSKDMMYSCAIWQPGDVIESLETAQQRKLLCFIRGAKIKATDHVLEIGTGWGSFAIEAVQRTGCRVTSITLSQQQKELAERRIKLVDLSHRIEVKLMDYRELITPPEFYDKIVSIEMVEAVGEPYLAEYFAGIHRLLKRDGGIAMFQSTVIPEALQKAHEKKKGFIDSYIFPGGYLPSTMQLLNHITTQSNGNLTIESVEHVGAHYIKTLRMWREKFLFGFDDKIIPALLSSHPGMSKEAIEVFRRKWEYYFTYCESGFITKTLENVIITVSRPGALEFLENIPI